MATTKHPNRPIGWLSWMVWHGAHGVARSMSSRRLSRMLWHRAWIETGVSDVCIKWEEETDVGACEDIGGELDTTKEVGVNRVDSDGRSENTYDGGPKSKGSSAGVIRNVRSDWMEGKDILNLNMGGDVNMSSNMNVTTIVIVPTISHGIYTSNKPMRGFITFVQRNENIATISKRHEARNRGRRTNKDDYKERVPKKKAYLWHEKSLEWPQPRTCEVRHGQREK